MKTTILKILDEVAVWSANHSWLWLEDLVTQFTYPKKDFPWLY